MARASEKFWIEKSHAAALVGLSVRQFSQVIQTRLSATGQKGRGVKLRFHAPAVVDALVAYRLEQAKPAPEDHDPLMTGSESPGMERYRMARAQLAERDLAERDRVLARTDALRAAILPAIATMRTTGERLIRQFGNDAGEIFNEGISEFEAAAQRLLKKHDTAPPPSKPK